MAYALWERVHERAADRGWNASELAEKAGLPRSTINNLQKSSRVPQPRIINALADAVGLDRHEAFRLAGRIPPKEDAATDDVDVRDAIQRSSAYTNAQKHLLLQMIDTIEAANAGRQPAG